MIDLGKLEKYMSELDSRYRAVIIASKRAKELKKGLRPLFEGKSLKVTTMALEEIVSQRARLEEAGADEAHSDSDPDSTPEANEVKSE